MTKIITMLALLVLMGCAPKYLNNFDKRIWERAYNQCYAEAMLQGIQWARAVNLCSAYADERVGK